MNAKKWTLRTLFFSLSVLIVLAITAYAIDPYLQYRITSSKHYLNSRFVNPGVIKNYNYDTVLIGSSMTHGFSMPSFRNKLRCKPLRATIGGISLCETKELSKLIVSVGRTNRIFVCVDLYFFSSEKETDEKRFPYYLMDNNLVNDYKYLLGYETWMRFIPISAAINALSLSGTPLPDKLANRTDVDYLGYKLEDEMFDENIVIDNYINSKYDTTKPNVNNLHERMIIRVDEYLKTLDYSIEYTFFFPPYSALFWYQAQEDNYFDIYQQIKAYIVSELSDRPNVDIYDFQSLPLICDLNNYRDSTHYSPEISELMIDCFASGDNRVNKTSILKNIEVLEGMVEQFRQDNSAWLNKMQ